MVLAHDVVGSGSKWLYVLHGIYGAGRNWGSVMRRLTGRRSDWGAVLVDLRQHGGSQGFEPPHTLEAAARDVAALIEHLDRPAAALLGHSFGGKVALMHGRLFPGAVSQLWIVDSTPDAVPAGGSAWQMLDVLKRLPQEFGSRDEGVAAMEARGIARPIAQWMATNLEERGGVYGWRISTADMEEMLADFFRSDLWDVVEGVRGATEIHFVKAEESSVLGPEAVRRIGDAGATVHLHVVSGGHWVNAENPDAIEALLADRLP